VGGHKKRCVALADRSVEKAGAAEAGVAKNAKGRQAAAAAEDGGGDRDGEDCVICLESLDDPEFGPAQILDCTHRFHKACVKELRKAGVQQACPMCRAKLPDSAEKMFDDGCTIFFSITCSSRELTVRGSVDSPVGEIPWFLCASAEKLHARGPLPVKEIAIYYDRWEGEGFALFSPRYG
jgi:hypothetical protein